VPIGSIGASQHLPGGWVSEETTFDTDASIGRRHELNNPANPVVLRKSVGMNMLFCPNYSYGIQACKFLHSEVEGRLSKGDAGCGPASLQHGTTWATGITGWTVGVGQPIVAMRGRKESNPRTDERSSK
jgi:hypothetical protein